MLMIKIKRKSFSSPKSSGTLLGRPPLKGGFLRYELEGNMEGKEKGLFSEFYGMFSIDFSKNCRGMIDLERKNSSLSYVLLYFQQNTTNQMRSQ